MRSRPALLASAALAIFTFGCSGGMEYNTGTDAAKEAAEIKEGAGPKLKSTRKVTKPPTQPKAGRSATPVD